MAADPLARLLGRIDRPVTPRPEFAEALLDRLLCELEQEPEIGRDPGELRQEDPMPEAISSLPATFPEAHPLAWPHHGFSGGRSLAYLVTAALVALALVTSFLAFGPRRPGGQDNVPVVLVALNEMSATPAAKSAPVAFLWQANGGPNLPVENPSLPAVDPEGRLWIPDNERNQFLLFAPDGTFLEAWGVSGTGEGEFRFTDPRSVGISFGSVAFDAVGNIYVADTGNYRIQKFGPDRAFVTSWGGEGAGRGQFRRPIALAVDGRGRVYVSDVGWGKVEVFDGAGAWLATWSGLGAPNGIAVDGDGNIWVAEEGGGVTQFSRSGEPLSTWDDYGDGDGQFLNAVGVAVDAQGRVFVADEGTNRIQVFAPDGAFLGAWGEPGDDAGQFRGLRGLVLDGRGGVYTTEQGGQRIQAFRLLPPFEPT